MGIYDVDYNDMTEKLLPIKYRVGTFLGWCYSLLKPIEILHANYFTYNKKGLQRPVWSNVTAYTVGQRVQYGESIFMCEVANAGNIPLLNLDKWSLVALDWIGTDERVQITGQKKLLEFELNKRFKKTFRQSPVNSDIYIENKAPLVVFVIGLVDNSSAVYNSGMGDAIYDNPIILTDNFIVWIPVAIITQTEAVRKEVEKYVNAGLIFSIQTY